MFARDGKLELNVPELRASFTTTSIKCQKYAYGDKVWRRNGCGTIWSLILLCSEYEVADIYHRIYFSDIKLASENAWKLR